MFFMAHKYLVSLLVLITACTVLTGCGLHSELNVSDVTLEIEEDTHRLAVPINCFDSQMHIRRKDECSDLVAQWEVIFLDDWWPSDEERQQGELEFIEMHTISVHTGEFETDWKNQGDAMSTFYVELDEMTVEMAKIALIRIDVEGGTLSPHDVLAIISRDEQGEIYISGQSNYYRF